MTGPQQTQGPQMPETVTVNVPGAMVGRPDVPTIKVQLPGNTAPAQMRDEAMRLAKAQADQSSVGLQAPGAGGSTRRLGLNLPMSQPDDGMAELMQNIAATAPQVAGLIAQFFPAVRAFGAAGSAAIPAMTRAATNAIEGKPVEEGVLGEAALGGATHLPSTLAEPIAKWGTSIMRHNLFSQTPVEELSSATRNRLTDKALDLRAAPTPEGIDAVTRKMASEFDRVEDLGGQIKSYTDVGYKAPADLAAQLEAAGGSVEDMRTIANALKGVEAQYNARGAGGAINAIMPGSGPMTTAVRATGVPAALGQVAAPAVAVVKGSPARRMAWARNMVRPGNVADTETIGLGLSQILRLLAASQMQPMAGPERLDVEGGGGGLPSPRRRQQ